MSFRLGVDVGGTFTDILLINETDGRVHTAKLASTPADPSVGVLDGIRWVCAAANIQPDAIHHVMHGSTVATNAILTGQGARVGLITTIGYRYVLQIARSFIPGGLGAWVNFNKTKPLAPLALTVEAHERIDANGKVVDALDEGKLRDSILFLNDKGIDALTISLINAYANDTHEQIAGRIAEEELPGIPISLSSRVNPEMQEYERAITTVCNSYVRPIVSNYVRNLDSELRSISGDVKLHILRSDGGLTSPAGAETVPVNLLMSGPAGGVAGAIWIARQSEHKDLLTFDMGGTSTDVAVVRDYEAQTRRETTVGDLTVRASSLDVRSVGAGGGSIAHMSELTRALRVGPQSAGAEPGPAGYGKGGTEPTVTDANIVLGYLPERALLGGNMKIDRGSAAAAVLRIADTLGFSVERAAEGIHNIANENMIGALRLVSVQQGYDPRDFALIAFGGAGPMHANAMARILGSWPVIVPPAPGVLCAYGDATTRTRDEASRTLMRRFSETTDDEVLAIFRELAERAAASLDADGIPRAEQSVSLEADVRYAGQILHRTVPVELGDFARGGLNLVGRIFDELHERLYTFALDVDRELINLRAIVQGKETQFAAGQIEAGGRDSGAAQIAEQPAYFGGQSYATAVYDRAQLCAGNVIRGPAIIVQLDSTTLILPGHTGEINRIGSIVIGPTVAT
jgi:N-methylhydantoinase A